MRSCSDDGFRGGGGGGGAPAGAGLAGFDGSVATAVQAFPFPISSSPFPRFSFSAEAGPRLAGAGAAGALLLRGRSGSLLGLGVVAIRGLALTRQQASVGAGLERSGGHWTVESLLASGGFVCLFGGDLEGGFKFETGESERLLCWLWDGKRSPPREPGSAGYLLGLFRGFLTPC